MKFRIALFAAFLVLVSLGLTSKKARFFAPISEPDYLKGSHSWAEQTLQKLTLEEKVAQFFMVASWPNLNEEHQTEIEQTVINDKVGGIIYFQGSKEQLKNSVKRMQSKSKTPLLIGIDGEWGAAMRVTDADRFPYAYTLGAANDTMLTEKIAGMIAQECRELGIHMNFAPVADVNSNPSNPVIGYRSFGQNTDVVANHVKAYVRGLEKNGILSCIKHFPGHGDTDKDSHYELPTLAHDVEHFKNTEFKPFLAGMEAGTSSVMIGHLSVPALDASKTPASLSPDIIKGVLQQQLQFQGLVISDALNMKAVSDKYGKVDVVVKAYEAGNDILLFPENVHEAIEKIVTKVKSGDFSLEEVNRRCLKILKAKEHAMHFKPAKSYSSGDISWAKRDCYEKAFTLLKNEKETLPIVNAAAKTAIVSIGVQTDAFQTMAKRFHDLDCYHFYSFEEAAERMKQKVGKYEHVITAVHPKGVSAASNYSSPGDINTWLASLTFEIKHSLVLFGNPLVLKDLKKPEAIKALVLAYENHSLAQESAAQLIFGALPAKAKLQFDLSDNYKTGAGIDLKDSKRLKFSQPEEVGVLPQDLAKIDAIVQKGLDAKAYPGCQILVAVDGKVIYRKNFGVVTYEDTVKVNDEHVYDIASISKIVGSTAALMRLQTENKFTLNHYLKDYIPEWVDDSPVGNIYIKNMMAHQAGFTPWIAFYKSTVSKRVLDMSIYSESRKAGFETPVASNLWIRNDYEKTIYSTILRTPLAKSPKYEYSDLGYYFAKKIIEKQSGYALDQFMYREFWDPMGLKNMRYTPLVYFPKERIVPTENDTSFRQRLIHGYVHDPGAAMLGGVGGHAGIFSNSLDLAAMMQLYLNKGFYANRQYISADIVKEYTSQQFKGNRRGAGFDRPTNNRKDGPTCPLVSLESFGHSGFTGTFTWADPAYGLNYVFLSNRVYPDATNKKIQEMHIRSDIQKVIYEALLKARKAKV